jgi:Na+-driven multidrug efflux pump
MLGLPVGIWLGFRTNAGPVGLWWGLTLGLALLALFLLLRVRSRMRRELRRIVIDEEADGS